MATSGGLAGPGRPASCSSRTRLDPEGHCQHPEHALQELQDGGGDAPAPAHEGPEERELRRAAERLRGQAALRAPAAGRAAAAERGGGVRGLRRHAAPRLEAPRHLRRGGARVLRVAQRADAQMVYILPERLPALVRPAFDLVLRRIRSLKRCVEA